MVKIIILTAMHKRPKVSELFAIALNRFIAAAPKDYSIEVIASISEPEAEQICKKYGFNYIMTENISVSHKWNVGMTEAMNINFDYLMITGDDDLFSNELWSHYQSRINRKSDYFGLRSIYFYEPRTNEACRFKYPYDKMIGCGRMMSRELIVTCTPLWEQGLSSGLDHSSETNILGHGFDLDFIDTTKPLAVDIKTNTNIWSLNSYANHGKAAVFKEIDFLTQQEIDYINTELK